MSDKPIWGETGKSPRDMAKEAGELTERLSDSIPAMKPYEAHFVQDMRDRLAMYEDDTWVTPKQLFLLRDLLEKYL